MKESLQTALNDAVDLLESRGFPHALIGGLGASVRGRTRVTEDVDFVVKCSVDEAIELSASLNDDVFTPLFQGVEEAIRRSFILPLRHQKTGIPVDFAIGVSGFEQQVISRATNVRIEDRELPVATAEDLLLMKVLAGRPQDDQDIEGIVSVGGNSLDWDYCIEVAEQLEQAVGIDMAKRIRALKGE